MDNYPPAWMIAEILPLGMVCRIKSVIIGLKSNVHDIADTFKRAYPNAQVLYPGKGEFTPEKRIGIFLSIKHPRVFKRKVSRKNI